MTYWVVRIDSDLPKLPNGVWSEVIIQGPYDWGEAHEIATRLNKAQARKDEAKILANTGLHLDVSPGTTIISYTVVSDEGLQQYYRIGTRVIR